MWEVGIAFQLSWFVGPDTAPATKTGVSRTTFSWISSPRPVGHELGKIRDRSAMCTFVCVRTVAANSDPSGRLDFASLTLCGPHVTGTHFSSAVANPNSDIHLKHRHPDNDLFNVLALNTDTAIEFLINMGDSIMNDKIYDRIGEVWDWAGVICFALLMRKKGNKVCMLVLRRTESDDTYVRIGFLRNVPKMWVDKYATECTVTLV
jgi:hypothetical protein